MWKVACLVTILCLYVPACRPKSERELELSIDELEETGYYAYVLPEQMEVSLGLIREIYIYSLDLHCYSPTSPPEYFPVWIIYRDSSGESYLDISISPRDTTTILDIDKEIVDIQSEWIPGSEGLYNRASTGINIVRFRDVVGMEVVISSLLEVDEIVNAISKLEYVGATLPAGENPWENACR